MAEKNLGKRLLEYLPEATFLGHTEVALANTKENLPFIKKTIAELDPSRTGRTTNVTMGR